LNILEKSGKSSCKISGADISGSGNVVFGLNVFGNPLVASESVTLPFGF
jgi:hypothetical protein